MARTRWPVGPENQIPPANVTLVVLSVVVVAITALTLWRRYAPARQPEERPRRLALRHGDRRPVTSPGN
jgi:hypothetical protein